MSIRVLLTKEYLDNPIGHILNCPAFMAEQLVYDMKIAKFVDIPSYHPGFEVDPSQIISKDDFVHEGSRHQVETAEIVPKKENAVTKRGRGRPKKVVPPIPEPADGDE